MGHQLKNLAFITTSSLLLAVAVVVFFSPNHIVLGGPPGISIILFHLLGISKGLTVLLLNAVLVLAGARLLGIGYLLRTAYAIATTALFIEALTWLAPDAAVTANPLLNTLYGGILAGIALALGFKGEAASGGWTLMARIIANALRIGVGQVVQFLDMCVIVASGIVFGDIEAALWAGIGVYVSGVVINMVIGGRANSKVVHVSTRQAEALSRLLPERLQDNGAVMHCNTVRDQAGHDLMLLVVETGQLARLNELVRETDPDASVVVMNATEFYSGLAHAKTAK